MDFLTLCQRAWRECGLSGEGPTSTLNQKSMAGNMVDWCATAWLDIQSGHHGWTFLDDTLLFQLVPGQRDYALADAPGVPGLAPHWRAPCKDFLLIQNGASSTPLQWLAYTDFRQLYERDAVATGRPSALTRLPNGALRFSVVPETAYPVRLGYSRRAQCLVEPLDVPLIDSEDCMAIVWRAVRSYAEQDNVGELWQSANAKYRSAYGRLCNRYLPEIEIVLGGLA
ncbi:MAG: hypothetical protein JNM11_00960 [Chitinimonas sp.]|nr:hypothetical protein [Chitinimonas sp.]